MKTLILGAAALALSAGMSLGAETVRIATEGAYPPFNFINDKGEIDGFERKLGDELCTRAALTCEWVKNDWDSIIPNLVSSNYDAIMAGMSITPEREKVIAFTQNYIPPADSAYVALKADANLNGNIAAQTSTIQAGHVAETGATLLEFATADETVAAVRNGEADAVFADREFLQKIVDESNGELTFAGEPVAIGGGVGMGLRQSDAELKATFDKAITSMKCDGSLDKLIVEYFGEKSKVFGEEGKQGC
jgi:polar amino acid transport system substrate-binding protein